MSYNVDAEVEEFRLTVEKSIAEFKKDPAKAREFLILAGTHRVNDSTGKLELVPELRS